MAETVPATGARGSHRERVLRALGVVPYALRRPIGVAPASSTDDVEATPALTCVLVLPAGCDTRQLTLIERSMQSLGASFARAKRVQMKAGVAQGEVPRADAYLAFGAAQAQALGRSLDGEAQERAEVVLLDAPDALLQAAAKRRLWQAVAGLRRRWRTAATARP